MGLRIIFMGTPDFAVPSLQILVESGYNVVGVITATDKYGGRGNKKLLESPVKKFAVAKGLTILQPEKFRNEDFLNNLKNLKADLQIVVAFRMLPEIVWNMPTIGTFNLHGSLLPKYRGAAPINWAVINGEVETGCTTFFIRHKIDTGDLLFQEKMPIGENETAGDVHDRMMKLGAGLVLKTVKAIEKKAYTLKEQDDSLATKAPKLFHDTCKINFNQDVKTVHNFIRGLSPWPAAWTTLNDLQLKILQTTAEVVTHDHPIGEFVTDNKKMLKIATPDGFIHVLRLQLQGKKRMDTVSFLNGYKIGN